MPNDYNTDALVSAIAVDIYDFNPLTGDETIHRYATVEFSYNSDDYVAYISEEGVVLGNQINDTLGGVQSLSWSANVSLINTSDVASLLNYNTLVNNRIDIKLFTWSDVTDANPSEFDTLYRGKIKSREFTNTIWIIRCEHFLYEEITAFPNNLITPENFARTNPDNYGKPVPFVYGDMRISPFDGKGRSGRLAKCIDVSDTAIGGYYPADVTDYRGGLYEYANGAWYEVVDYAINTDGTTNITSSKRKYRNRIAYGTADNDLDGWEIWSDGNSDTGIILSSRLRDNEFFEGVFSQSTDRGTIQEARLVIERTGTYLFDATWGVTLLKEGTNVLSDTRSSSSDDSLYIRNIDVTQISWDDLALLTVKIPEVLIEVAQVYIEITFLRKEDDTLPDIYQAVTGFNSNNPIAQVKDILTRSTMCNIASEHIDDDSFTASQELRSDWEFSFQLLSTEGVDYISRILQECSAFLFIKNNKIACGVRTNENEPTAAIVDTKDVMNTGRSIFCDFLPENRVISDISLRYNRDSANGKYNSISINSSLSRKDTPDTVTVVGGKYRGANLQAEKGDIVYNLTTGRIDTATVVNELTIQTDESLGAHEGGRILYGPYLSAKSMRSKYVTKTSRSMAGTTPNFAELGSYDNEFIYTKETAELWVDSILDNLSQLPIIIKIASYWKYANVSIGDTILIDSSILPENARPARVGVLQYNMPSSEYFHAVYLKGLSAASVGDYIAIGTEIMKVLTRGNRYFYVERGALHSNIDAHSEDDEVKLFTSKFQVKNIAPNLNNLAWAITAERVSPYYGVEPFLGGTAGSGGLEPSQETLESNFLVGTANELLNEPAPTQLSSRLSSDVSMRNYMFESRTHPLAKLDWQE